MVPPARPVVKQSPAPKQQQQPISQLKTYSNPDILICGNCREMFTELQELLDHKKTYCKLRFACKCHTLNGVKTKSAGDDLTSAMLLCVACKDCFRSPWDLMVHVQAAHMMNIYELGVPKAAAAAAAAAAEGDDDLAKRGRGCSPAASPSPRSSDGKEKEDGGERECTPSLDDEDDAADLAAHYNNMASPDADKDDDADAPAGRACIVHTLAIEQTTVNKKSSAAEKSPMKVSITNGDISTQE